MRYTHENEMTCSVSVSFELDGDKVRNVEFIKGCPGNLAAISKLVEGMSVDEIEEKLAGNQCGARGTSCVDQFAKAVREAYESVNA